MMMMMMSNYNVLNRMR